QGTAMTDIRFINKTASISRPFVSASSIPSETPKLILSMQIKFVTTRWQATPTHVNWSKTSAISRLSTRTPGSGSCDESFEEVRPDRCRHCLELIGILGWSGLPRLYLRRAPRSRRRKPLRFHQLSLIHGLRCSQWLLLFRWRSYSAAQRANERQPRVPRE